MKNESVNIVALAVLVGLLVLVVGFAWAKFSSPRRNPNLDGGNSEVLPEAQGPDASASFQKFDVYFIDNSEGQVEADDCSLELVGSASGPFLTDNLLQSAVTRLATVEDEFLVNESQYNALYESDLTFLASRVQDGVATVELRGWLRVENGCQQTQAISQLEETIKQVAKTSKVQIVLNQRPIEDGLRFEPVD